MAKKIVKVLPNTDVTWSLSRTGFTMQSGALPNILTNEQVQAFLEAGMGEFFYGGTSNWYLLNGDLYGCGSNTYGQQGSGDTTSVTAFTKRASNVKDVWINSVSTWYITNDGDLYGCGRNNYGQQGSGNTTDVTTFTKRASNVKKVVGYGSESTWYIDNNGDLYGCGYNNYGQQGSGGTTDVKTFTKRGSDIKDVFPGNYITWYITNNGDLYGCGYNKYGNQGANSTTDVKTFTKRASNVKFLSCSSITSWYINNDGDLYGCGYNNYGQQGAGNTTDVKIFTKRASGVKEIYADKYLTWYLTEGGSLYCCGENANGNLSGNTTTNRTSFANVASNVREMRIDQYISRYITNDGDLYICGQNKNGCQGSGSTTNILSFTKRAENVRTFAQTSRGSTYYNSFYIDNNGDLYGCGINGSGQLGTGTTDDVLTFTKIGSNVKDCWTASNVIYLTNDGELYVCGSNTSGQLGLGTAENVLTPTKSVEGLSGLTADLTINPTPEDATVIIDGDVTTSKEVPQGKLFNYSVSKDGYRNISEDLRLYENKELNIELEKREVISFVYPNSLNGLTYSGGRGSLGTVTYAPLSICYGKECTEDECYVWQKFSKVITSSEIMFTWLRESANPSLYYTRVRFYLGDEMVYDAPWYDRSTTGEKVIYRYNTPIKFDKIHLSMKIHQNMSYGREDFAEVTSITGTYLED